ncbi:sigma-54 dependent transcriptional regulator [Geobacter sp. AOG2]|uniref:sigma-54-dependent transcriptional regulator n=1 Tax=Geobacter sp. AOG2 TaxID=1566347 RepID=UPI001CC7AA88|nr:sigma-54 dependent transcriptional regulator [Geobacter sp. AOG2]GFE61295.1 acetoacetate metabolism regulatory protein AtoC [Geobacter sp. AOG2]
MKTRILIVDDELSMREFLAILLEREGYQVAVAANAEEALGQIDGSLFDLVISDVQMPGLNGIDLLARIKQTAPDTAVLMVTAFTAADQAVEAMKLGAYDYISKPFKNEEIKILISKALEKQGLKRENTILRQEVAHRDGFCGIIGKSARMRELFDMIQKVASSQSSVLILGESGTGKELAARAIHECSPRKAKPFVAVNCGAIPESLIESELFGHKKGAFTGAVADRPGLFEQAEGGTLFLDEIGELPLLLQTKLLRVLQEREFRRVGDAKVYKADVRVLTASNRDLDEDIKNGGFREDLYYRINVVQIVMPPLRERIEDIPLLVEHFCRKLHPDTPASVSPGALKALMNYGFPGNIRELENIVERSLILDSELISEGNLPKQVAAGRAPCLSADVTIPDEGMFLEPLLENLERQYLLKALEKTGGAKKKAAELLGMSFRSFRYRLAKLGMDSETA